MKLFTQWLAALALAVSMNVFGAEVKKSNPQVRLITNVGTIELELYPDKAPETVKNFLDYVDTGFYNGTVFHRVIPHFMIQGGGYTSMSQGTTVELTQKPPHAPIRNEASNGLKNLTGTIAMARAPDPHSASSQFFINTADNEALNFWQQSADGWGYCVFGKVIKGMEVVRKIESSPTRIVGLSLPNLPAKDMVITNAERIVKK